MNITWIWPVIQSHNLDPYTYLMKMWLAESKEWWPMPVLLFRFHAFCKTQRFILKIQLILKATRTLVNMKRKVFFQINQKNRDIHIFFEQLFLITYTLHIIRTRDFFAVLFVSKKRLYLTFFAILWWLYNLWYEWFISIILQSNFIYQWGIFSIKTILCPTFVYTQIRSRNSSTIIKTANTMWNEC